MTIMPFWQKAYSCGVQRHIVLDGSLASKKKMGSKPRSKTYN